MKTAVKACAAKLPSIVARQDFRLARPALSSTIWNTETLTQKMGAILHYLSLSCLRLSVFNENGTLIDRATGFFYENEQNDLFLITNWHVVTGRQPQCPSHSKTGAIPTKVTFDRPTASDHEGQAMVDLAKPVTFELVINSQDGNNPSWIEHPILKNSVDVVAIPLTNRGLLEAVCPVHPINKYPQLEPRFSPSVMDAVTVIGFPWGLTGGGPLPIYKRGSIASEPSYSQMRLPRFLIDCVTAPSMSGSPIMASHSGLWSPVAGGLSAESTIGTVENFVGVYSGRLTALDFGNHSTNEVTELGLAWRKDALDEIVNSGVAGTTLNQVSATAPSQQV